MRILCVKYYFLAERATNPAQRAARRAMWERSLTMYCLE